MRKIVLQTQNTSFFIKYLQLKYCSVTGIFGLNFTNENFQMAVIIFFKAESFLDLENQGWHLVHKPRGPGL